MSTKKDETQSSNKSPQTKPERSTQQDDGQAAQQQQQAGFDSELYQKLRDMY